MPATKPLWAVTLEDLGLGVRAYNALAFYRRPPCTKAWHVAALCDRCLLHLRQFGPACLREVRTALQQRGFSTPACPCRTRDEVRTDTGWRRRCELHLQICRALLEEGQWRRR